MKRSISVGASCAALTTEDSFTEDFVSGSDDDDDDDDDVSRGEN